MKIGGLNSFSKTSKNNFCHILLFQMTEYNHFRCVNCGEPAAALYKTYGPTVLKLTKCEKCKGIVDKYTEYDPVIVMIDLVLLSKEAQRHVLYNTEFKSYWKLLVILVMLETYGVWKNDSFYNIIINTACGIQNNTTANYTLSVPIGVSLPESWRNSCQEWAQEANEDNDLFIWEKDFYVKFISIFAGIAAFIVTVQSSMLLLRPITSQNRVSPVQILKAFSLADVSILFTLPTLVWGTHSGADTRALHFCLVFAYSFVVFTSVFHVLYESSRSVTVLILCISIITKYSTSFYTTLYIRSFVT